MKMTETVIRIGWANGICRDANANHIRKSLFSFHLESSEG